MSTVNEKLDIAPDWLNLAIENQKSDEGTPADEPTDTPAFPLGFV
ncbi:hypothetical protein BH11ARM1_BH11ARM1_04280 [soil metagenome]